METKKCKQCNKTIGLEYFYRSAFNADGYESKCKECRKFETYNAKLRRKLNNPDLYKEKHNKANKRFYSKPGIRRNENLYHLYRVRQDWYDAKLLEQGGGCAICGGQAKENKYMHIDHNHTHHSDPRKGCPDCLRGVLCEKCNRGVGCFDEDITTIKMVIRYLEQYGTTTKNTSSRVQNITNK